MTGKLLRFVILAFGLTPALAGAEPVTLKLSFFTSDRSVIYQCQIKPFVDAVNVAGAGLVQIKVYFSGAISPVQSEQRALLLNGAADIANVAIGYSPEFFPNTSVLELPGLFHDPREASLVFTRLVETHALEGYQDFFAIGAFVSGGESIHSRKPISSLDDLRGQRIRVNNDIEAETLHKLGAVPMLLPLNRTMAALSEDKLDGITVPPPMLFEFGFGRLTSQHYLLQLGGAPVGILMNRAKLMSLPPPAQEIIRKYSGAWMAEQETSCMAAADREVVARLRADSRRKVVEPSPGDVAAARRIYESVTAEWTAQSPQHRELLSRVQAELQTLRSRKDIGK